jgi:hypothetical protein
MACARRRHAPPAAKSPKPINTRGAGRPNPFRLRPMPQARGPPPDPQPEIPAAQAVRRSPRPASLAQGLISALFRLGSSGWAAHSTKSPRPGSFRRPTSSRSARVPTHPSRTMTSARTTAGRQNSRSGRLPYRESERSSVTPMPSHSPISRKSSGVRVCTPSGIHPGSLKPYGPETSAQGESSKQDDSA